MFADLVKRLGLATLIDQHVSVLQRHAPYHESDHVLAQVMNLHVGGTCLEDLAHLQQSEAVLRLVGACRLPDPTTAGDFLRRLDEHDANGLAGLRRASDEAQDRAWRLVARRTHGSTRRRELAVVDLDGHVKPLYGATKQGADFFKGTWCYQPLVATLAGTGECLAIRNQPGAVRASSGAPAILDATLPRTKQHFERVLVRGDSDFDRADVRDACLRHQCHFAFVGREFPNRPGIAESLPETRWKPFRTQAHRERVEQRKRPGRRSRRKPPNLRRRRARERGFKDLRLVEQWIAEVPWTPPGAAAAYRLGIRRQRIANYAGAVPELRPADRAR